MTATRHLGLDLGGTNVKVAVVERTEGATPTVLARTSVPTRAAEGPEAVAAVIAGAGRDAIVAHGPVASIGLGVPGLFDATDGTIVLFPNLPGPWRGFPLRDRVADGIGQLVTPVNDARAHTLAESRLGAGVGASTMLMVTLGTGMGGGVIIDGRLRLGPTGTAGEIGHQTVRDRGRRCGCGNLGCAEAYAASGTILATAGRASMEEVFARAAEGDERCRTALADAVDAVAIAVANLMTVLVPDRVVIGGGVAEAGEAIMGPLRAAIAERTPLIPPGTTGIVTAQLGPWAGAIGAAIAGAEGLGEAD